MHARSNHPLENRTRAISPSLRFKKKSLQQEFDLIDNRKEDRKNRIINGWNKNAIHNMKTPLQLYASKRVLDSARRHYNDGWGARYNIRNDAALQNRVPDAVRGSGTIGLNRHHYRNWVYRGARYRRYKNCNILYRTGRDIDRSKQTVIYHCGPTGPSFVYRRIYRNGGYVWARVP